MANIQRPTREELILYLLEKLNTDRIQEIDSLLEFDQTLDDELCQIESEIGKYIAKHNLYKLPISAEDSYKDFIRKYSDLLDQPKILSTLNYRQSHLTKLKILLAGGRQLITRRSLLFAALFLIISASSYFFLFYYSHTVTAEEFVQNVIKAEIARVKKVAEPVIYRRLQVQKKSSGKEKAETWETSQDIQKNESKYKFLNQSVSKHISNKQHSEIASQLAMVLKYNNFGQILSASAFNDWRNTLKQKTDQVNKFELSKDQSRFELVTNVDGNHPVNSIIAVSIIVNSKWEIVSEQINVQGIDEIIEYVFSEIDFRGMTRSEAERVFDTDDKGSEILFGSTTKFDTDASPNINNENSDLSSKDLIEAEISVLVVLHDVGADLDGQIDVTRGGDEQIIIQGDVSPILRKKIIDSVSSISTVPVNFTKFEKKDKGRSVNNRIIEINITGTDDTELQSQVQQYYVAKGLWKNEDSNKNLVELSRSVVSESEAAYRQAWALNQLHKKVISGELYPDPRIDKMKLDYIARINAHYKRIRSQLQPALLSFIDKQGLVVQSTQTQNELIYKSIDQLFRLICVHFAGGEESDKDENSAKEMLRVFMTLDSLLSN